MATSKRSRRRRRAGQYLQLRPEVVQPVSGGLWRGRRAQDRQQKHVVGQESSCATELNKKGTSNEDRFCGVTPAESPARETVIISKHHTSVTKKRGETTKVW